VKLETNPWIFFFKQNIYIEMSTPLSNSVAGWTESRLAGERMDVYKGKSMDKWVKNINSLFLAKI
jgi:hypothetical protein